MKQVRVVVSLPGENKYLHEQVAVAEATAQRLGIGLRVINADSDPVTQSQQLLELIQSSRDAAPDAIIVEPVTESGLPRVAEAAVAAGIGWVVSNARVDYVERLRKKAQAPVFTVSQDHAEIGRLQAKQFAALLPEGGSVLYLRGPASNSLACQRAEGLESAMPSNIHVRSLKIQWTEKNAYESLVSWLRLSTVHAADYRLISSQNTDFISAARKAFQEHAPVPERLKWLGLMYTGAGVLSQTKPLVEQGVLTAAVVTSATTGTCLEMLHRSVTNGTQPPEQTFVSASSFPPLEELAKKSSRLAESVAGK